MSNIGPRDWCMLNFPRCYKRAYKILRDAHVTGYELSHMGEGWKRYVKRRLGLSPFATGPETGIPYPGKYGGAHRSTPPRKRTQADSAYLGSPD